MKRKIYHCDGGCILIGNSSSRFHIPNGYGDGGHSVIVYESREEYQNEIGNRKPNWVGVVEGTDLVVYKYDCLSPKELFASKNILFRLSGSYGVYIDYGVVHLVKRGGVKVVED